MKVSTSRNPLLIIALLLLGGGVAGCRILPSLWSIWVLCAPAALLTLQNRPAAMILRQAVAMDLGNNEARNLLKRARSE